MVDDGEVDDSEVVALVVVGVVLGVDDSEVVEQVVGGKI